jgi:hypothetical protein
MLLAANRLDENFRRVLDEAGWIDETMGRKVNS